MKTNREIETAKATESRISRNFIVPMGMTGSELKSWIKQSKKSEARVMKLRAKSAKYSF